MIDEGLQFSIHDIINKAVRTAFKSLLDQMKVGDAKLFTICNELKAATVQINAKDKPVQGYSNKTEDLPSDLAELKPSVQPSSSETVQLKQINEQLMFESEQYSRRESLGIRGLKISKTQSTDNAICNLVSTLNVEIPKFDVSGYLWWAAIRKQIIVKFLFYRKRTKLLSARRRIKNI